MYTPFTKNNKNMRLLYSDHSHNIYSGVFAQRS